MISTSAIEWKLAKVHPTNKLYEVIADEELKSSQKILLKTLVDFDDICRLYDLKYCIIAGTLLGAIRHRGFIPWDNDIDIVMDRGDYEKLKIIFQTVLIDSKFKFYTPEISEDITTHAKFFNSEQQKDDFNSFLSKDYLDILPIDNVPKSLIKRITIGTIINLLGAMYSSGRISKNKSPHLYYLSKYSIQLSINMLIRRLLALPVAIVGHKKFFSCIEYILKSTKEDSGYITIALGVKNYFGEIIPRSVIFPFKTIHFEGKEVLGPNNPDFYLKHRYGNYTSIPDVGQQNERLIKLRTDWHNIANEIELMV